MGALYDALLGIHTGVSDDEILTRYSELRSEKYLSFVDPMSVANFKRLCAKDPEVTIANDEFFHQARKAQADQMLARQILEVREYSPLFV